MTRNFQGELGRYKIIHMISNNQRNFHDLISHIGKKTHVKDKSHIRENQTTIHNIGGLVDYKEAFSPPKLSKQKKL